MKLDLGADKYLNATVVKDGDQVVFKNEGRMVDDPFNPGNKRFQIEVEIVGRESEGEYTWTMNKTSLKNLAKKYGDDTANWVGKYATIKIVDQIVRNQPRKVILGYPLE